VDVSLRPWRAEDAPFLAAAAADPLITRWSSIGDGVEAWLAVQDTRPRRVSRAVVDVVTGRVVGRISVRVHDSLSGEVGYWTLPGERGRGVAKAAVRLMARFAFEELGLSVLVLDIEEGNVASLRVAAALGAVPGECHVEVDRDGVARQMIVHRLEGPLAGRGA
jgi:RimJ/RimL family protein N-acetyltransferase